MKSEMVNACEQEEFVIEHLQNVHSDSMSSNHYHSNFEVYYLTAGERYYFIEDCLYKIKVGDLILINANDLHKTLKGSTDKFSRILLSFDRSFLKDIVITSYSIHYTKLYEGSAGWPGPRSRASPRRRRRAEA